MCCKWFSIETAPKGEKWKRPKILLWNGQEVCIGHWDADEYSKKPRPFWSYTGSLGKNSDRASQPTHWMPLPVAPGSAPPAPTASPASGVGVRVKPLGWTDHPAGGEQALAAGLGLYRVHANGDDWYLVPDHMGKGGKAAAQADYEHRIRSALVASPEQGEVVRLIDERLSSLDAMTAGYDRPRDEIEIRRQCFTELLAALAKIGATQ